MYVSDRVMSGGVNAFYNPAVFLECDVLEAGHIHILTDMEDVLKRVNGEYGAETAALVVSQSRIRENLMILFKGEIMA